MLYILLDALGGCILAFTLILLQRVLISRKYKYKFRGVVSQSNILNGMMNASIVYKVGDEERTFNYSLKLSDSEKKKMSQVENFSRGFKKGNKFILMADTEDASESILPNDSPVKLFIFMVILLVIFHVSAFLSVGSLIFSMA